MQKYAQKWKSLTLPTTEEWCVKMLELAEIVKLASLMREQSIIVLIADWKPLIDFVHETNKNDLMTCRFDD